MSPEKYIDVNVIVYYLTGHKTFGEKAKEWLLNTKRKYTSVMAPFLVGIVLARELGRPRKDPTTFEVVLDAIESLGIELLDMPSWREVLNVMRDLGLDIEDAIHVATARIHGLEIVNNDDELKRKAKAVF